jgi:outer membrane protein OmpA-like peptidoglycan-associated protein
VGGQGIVGVVGTWTPYRAFGFDEGRSDVRMVDQTTAREISQYLSQNPSLGIALDGSTDMRFQNLSVARTNAVRSSLIQAGVPAHKIQSVSFNDPQLARDGRVEVLLATR